MKTISLTSKISILVLCIVFLLFGFCFGIGYQKLISPPKANLKAEDTPIANNSQDFKCTEYFCFKGNQVFLKTQEGRLIVIAQGKDDDGSLTKWTTYDNAILSPNQNFVFLSGHGYESNFQQIYDFKSSKIFPLQAEGQPIWFNDERLMIIGECGMGYKNCGEIWLSINGLEPWKQKLFAQTPTN